MHEIRDVWENTGKWTDGCRIWDWDMDGRMPLTGQICLGIGSIEETHGKILGNGRTDAVYVTGKWTDGCRIWEWDMDGRMPLTGQICLGRRRRTGIYLNTGQIRLGIGSIEKVY